MKQLSVFIARRYLISKKKTHAINIISWLALGSIAVITAALVIILSALNGLTGLVSNIYNAPEPDIRISPKTGKYFIPDAAFWNYLNTYPRVRAVSKVLEDKALIQKDSRQLLVNVKGVDQHLTKVVNITHHIIEGYSNWDSNAVFIGNGIANALQLDLKNDFSSLRLLSPKLQAALPSEQGLNELYIKPKAIFSLNDDFDYTYVFVSLNKARELFDITSSITAVYVAIDAEQSKRFQTEFKVQWGSYFNVTDRNSANETLFKTLESEKLMTVIILGFIMAISVFNTIGAITMLIMEKKKDILTYLAMGMDLSRIRKIFMWEGILITGTGSIIGLTLGIVFCALQQHFHWISFGNDAVIPYYPVEVKWQDLVMLFVLIMGLSAISGHYPIRFFTKQFNSKK